MTHVYCSHCFRYNPCSAIRDCAWISEVAICKTRKIDTNYGAWSVGQRNRAYFDTSIYPFDGIDIVYPFLRPTTRTIDQSSVRVKCAKDGQIDTFEYEYGSESDSNDREPLSADFFLTTRYACPPKPSTPSNISQYHPIPSNTSHISMPFWLYVVLSFGVIITFCVCAASCSLKCWKRSSPEEQLNGHGEVALNSGVSSFFHRPSNFVSREYYTSAEASARESPSGPEVHLPQNSRSHIYQAIPQEAQWSRSQSQTRAGSHRSALELLEPPTYEAVLRLKELESSDACVYVIAPNNQQNRL